MRRRSLILMSVILLPVLVLGGAVATGVALTEIEISGYEDAVRGTATSSPHPVTGDRTTGDLPEPVRRYLAFALPDPQARYPIVRLEAAGDFRRPLTDGFAPTTATQVIATGTPALMFAATTPIVPGVWARAFDYFGDGQMEMRARVLSVIPVVHESATAELNRISLRRWLLESPLYPMALLPGGPVRWEAVDESRSRAIVSAFGLEASLIASFRPDGSLASFDAEQDGDLTTPYHGSGEHAARDDYRLVAGMMIPHSFIIARASGGTIHPFWRGRITAIAFE